MSKREKLIQSIKWQINCRAEHDMKSPNLRAWLRKLTKKGKAKAQE